MEDEAVMYRYLHMGREARHRTCWPKVTINQFYGFDDNKTYVVICTNQVLVVKSFSRFKGFREFLPLKEGVGDSRRPKYGIKAQYTQTLLIEKPG